MSVRAVALSWWSGDKWQLLILLFCVSLESSQSLSLNSTCLYPQRYLINPVLFLRWRLNVAQAFLRPSV